jgi:hypothetical protein
MTSEPYDKKLSSEGNISAVRMSLTAAVMMPRERTIKEVNGVGLEEGMGQLIHAPHCGGDLAHVECQCIDKLVDIVKQI